MVKVNRQKERAQVINDLIIQIRLILNELCADTSKIQNTQEKLILSRCLDELIVESLKLSKSNSTTTSVKTHIAL